MILANGLNGVHDPDLGWMPPIETGPVPFPRIISSETILADAVCMWTGARKHYRDSLIYVGQRLHQYVLARLREGLGKNERDRLLVGASRQQSTLLAAKALNCHVHKIGELIRAAAVVDVFGAPGKMSYTAVEWWRLCIRRKSRGKPMKRNRKAQSSTAGGKDYYPIEYAETWEVHEDCKEWASATYKLAADEGWIGRVIRDHIIEKVGRTNLDAIETARCFRHSTVLDQFNDILESGDPRDIAEMIVEMVNKASKSEQVKKLLKAQL